MADGGALEFGPFRLDVAARVLYRDGRLMSLPLKDVEVLLALAGSPGRVVTKEELLHSVWPDVVVEEGNLARHVSNLRSVLGDGAGGGRFIETVPKRGYRFVAHVRPASSPGAGGMAGGADAAAPSPPAAPAAAAAEPQAGSPPPPPVEAAAVAPGRRLRRAAFAAAALLAAAAALLVASRWHSPRRVMLAVLPVENLSGDRQQEFVSDGLTEELISRLGGLDPGSLGVIARTSAMAYKGTRKTVAEIGRELGVQYVLESSLRSSGERFRVTTQLIRVSDQSHLWAQDYDRTLGDLVGVQHEVAQAVAARTHLRLSASREARFALRRAVDPEAYRAYLLGRWHWNQRTREGLLAAVAEFQRALERDPSDARAWAGLADAWNLLLFYGYERGAFPIVRATEAARKAVELDDGLAEGHAALGYVNFMWLWDWPAAEREFRRARDLDANYAPARHWYALYLAAMDRLPLAAREIEEARSLDPLSPILELAAAWIAWFAGDHQRAETGCRAVLERQPRLPAAHAVLGLALESQGRASDAVEALREAVSSGGGPIPYLGGLGHALARAEMATEARAVLDQLDGLARRGAVVQYAKALVHAGLGDRESALRDLLEAREAHDAAMIWLKIDPRLAAVRTDARLAEFWSANPPAGPEASAR